MLGFDIWYSSICTLDDCTVQYITIHYSSTQYRTGYYITYNNALYTVVHHVAILNHTYVAVLDTTIQQLDYSTVK